MSILSCFFSQGGPTRQAWEAEGLSLVLGCEQETYLLSGLSILVSKAVGLKYQTERVPQRLTNAVE